VLKVLVRLGFILALTALIGAAGMVAIQSLTEDRIEANQKQTLLRAFNALIPASEYDNDPSADVISVDMPDTLGGAGRQGYLAKRKGTIIGTFLEVSTRQGYSGTIRLLIAIRNNGTLGGVRVLEHHETPGLGDGIEVSKSPWITIFSGTSLNNPSQEKWKVKKDGGVFDQFTGATITPRAIVTAIRDTLVYVEQNHEKIFGKQP
jgi:Na+-translocating ferredoxin:NAD+ oxidoreductase subunit G